MRWVSGWVVCVGLSLMAGCSDGATADPSSEEGSTEEALSRRSAKKDRDSDDKKERKGGKGGSSKGKEDNRDRDDDGWKFAGYGKGEMNPSKGWLPWGNGNGAGSMGGMTAPKATNDIIDTAVDNCNFKTLVAAVQTAGLEGALRGAGPFTVFAPTDDAFAKLPSFLTTQLLSPPYKTELGLILKYHVLPTSAKAADFLGKTQSAPTLQGGSLSVDGSNNMVVVNGSVNVVTPDVLASNGVIHAIDNVLLPTIVDTAVGYDDGTTKFTSLVSALKSAGLVDVLSGKGPFTVFAPTDAAFASLKATLGTSVFNSIVSDKAKLTKILTYHVVSGTVFAKDVPNGEAPTLEGGAVKLSKANGAVKVGDSTPTPAKVVLPDLPASNGVIHVIDKVLIPANL